MNFLPPKNIAISILEDFKNKKKKVSSKKLSVLRLVDMLASFQPNSSSSSDDREEIKKNSVPHFHCQSI